MSNVIELPPRDGETNNLPPPDTKRDRAFLRMVAEVSPAYGYRWQPDPPRRRAMPLGLLWDLGFRHAAVEFAKQTAARERRAQWGR